MNNFFYEESDFALFKKALKATGTEPVVINILSSDKSLKTDAQGPKPLPERRSTPKSYNEKYQPNTYDRMFGPRRRSNTPIDMNNFSGWRNKNFRKTEQDIETTSAQPKFSLSDYMNQRLGKNKFNGLDTAKNDKQKSIDKIGSDDPQYKKYYLDSYMSKLEQESNVKKKYDEDILTPLDDNLQQIVPDSDQDEDFGYNDDSVKKIVDDTNTRGEKYRIDPTEFDVIKKKIDDKNKPPEVKKQVERYVLGDDEDFDLSKFNFDDEEESKPQEKKDKKPELVKREFSSSRNNGILARRLEQMQKQREANDVAKKDQEEKLKNLEELQAKIDELVRETEAKPDAQKAIAIEQGKSKIVVQENVSRREVDEMYIRRLEEYLKVQKVEETAKSRKKKREELNNELKTNLQKSEIEMNKKLLEIASKQGKDESIQRRSSSKKIDRPKTKDADNVNNSSNVDNSKASRGAAIGGGIAAGVGVGIGIGAAGGEKPPRKKRKYNPRRRMDSDIVGNIDF